VGEDGSEIDETTPAFVKLFMLKVKRLDEFKEYGSETQWESGKSECPEKQWKSGKTLAPKSSGMRGKAGVSRPSGSHQGGQDRLA
jgi:hypothetical protein